MDNHLVYKLSDKPKALPAFFYSLQWFFFTFAGSLVIPVVIGQAFGLSPLEHAAFLQRTFLVVGLGSFLQAVLGHRYPIIEGPAGMWWGIFLILLNLAPTLHKTPMEIGRNLEMGLLITGAVLILLGGLGWISKIQKLFTPIITGTYMVLLAVSMSGAFIKGMLGIGYHGNDIKWTIALLSIFLTSFVIFLSNSKKIVFRSFSILIGIIVGWGIYAIAGLADQPMVTDQAFFSIPRFFAFGLPTFDLGVVLTSLLTGFILISNIIASIAVMGNTIGEKPAQLTYNRGGVFSGVTHVLSGAGSTVGMVPLVIAAGMVEITGVAARMPFLLSALMMMMLGFIPSFAMFFAALPAPVGYAVLFTTFAQLLSFGLKEYGKVAFNNRNLSVIGLSLMLGIGTMFLPKEFLTALHPFFSYLLGNGFILGVLTSMILEHVVYPKGREQ